MTAVFGDPRLPQRFWDKVAVNDQTGCWEWTAYINDKGYGLYSVQAKRTMNAHRAAFIALEFDPGRELECDHLCRVRHCVNTNHLRAVTHKVNVLAGIGVGVQNAKKTHCIGGHPLSGDNIRMVATGAGGVKRQCITCAAERMSRVDATHGTSSGYRLGCRCAPCTAHQRGRMREYRAAKRAAALVSMTG